MLPQARAAALALLPAAGGGVRCPANGDRAVLERLARQFAAVARPAHFTDFTHCAECAAHDERLQACRPASLGLEDVAYAADAPFCVARPAGFLYFLPALARLALAPPSGEHGWYGAQLLFHLAPARRANGFFDACDTGQRVAVGDFLRHLLATRATLARDEGVSELLFDCHRLWAATSARPLLN